MAHFDRRSGPERSSTTAQGHPRTIFRRALERENLVLAEVTAREVGYLSLREALELVALVARKAPERYDRFAARWLRRYIEERQNVTLEEAAFVVGSLVAAPTSEAALKVLRELVAASSNQ